MGGKGADKPSISTTKDSNIEITENKDFKIDLKNLKGDAIDLYVQVVAKMDPESHGNKDCNCYFERNSSLPCEFPTRKLQMERSSHLLL